MNRKGWPTVSELLQELSGTPSDSRSVRVDQLRWLGRYGLVEDIESLVRLLRNTSHWEAPLALEVSLAWLLAGQVHQANLAFLEADDLDPSLALVPDVWELWSTPAREPRSDINELAKWICDLRRLGPTALYAAWRQRVEADWTMALTSPGLDELILLLRYGSALEPSIQPFLAALVGEGPMAASPAQALQFWGLLTDIQPDWTHARLRAADLALTCAEGERCTGWIATASQETQRIPWYWDITARAALENGAVALALDHWGQALADAPPELAELFRQRRREARRGTGVLQARSLLQRGEASAALVLLQRLVADDPLWQPLRALMQQAESAIAASGGSEALSQQASQRFGQFLERAAARIGLLLPPASPGLGTPAPDVKDARQPLTTFSSFLSEAEARFALGD